MVYLDCISLRKITDDLYNERSSDGIDKAFTDQDGKKYFYEQQTKYFDEIFFVLDLKAEKRLLKRNGNFVFNEDDSKFVKELLAEFTGKLDLMRRGIFAEVDDRFIIWVFEGVMRLFRNNNVSETDLQLVANKMYNRIDYPIRKKRAIMLKMQDRLHEVIDRVFEPKFVNYLTRMDNYIWLSGIEKDFSVFMSEWLKIREQMSEIRECEVWEAAHQSYTEDEIEEAKIQFLVAEDFNLALKNDSEYNKLEKEYNDILGIPDEKHIKKINIGSFLTDEANKLDVGKKKKRIVAANKKRIDQLCVLLEKKKNEIYENVVSKKIPGYKVKKPFTSEIDADFSSMCSAEDLLRQAIVERQEKIQFDKELEERLKNRFENISKIDIDSLLKDIKANIEVLGNE